MTAFCLLLLCGTLQVYGVEKLLGLGEEEIKDRREEGGEGEWEGALESEYAVLDLDGWITYKCSKEVAVVLQVWVKLA